MNFTSSYEEDVLIIVPKIESLDAADATLFKENVQKLIDDQEKKKVLINLEQLLFIDSSGLGTLLSLLKQMKNVGGNLKLCCLSSTIKNMFQLVKMDKLIEIHPSKEEAIKSYSKAAIE